MHQRVLVVCNIAVSRDVVLHHLGAGHVDDWDALVLLGHDAVAVQTVLDQRAAERGVPVVVTADPREQSRRHGLNDVEDGVADDDVVVDCHQS